MQKVDGWKGFGGVVGGGGPGGWGSSCGSLLPPPGCDWQGTLGHVMTSPHRRGPPDYRCIFVLEGCTRTSLSLLGNLFSLFKR